MRHALAAIPGGPVGADHHAHTHNAPSVVDRTLCAQRAGGDDGYVPHTQASAVRLQRGVRRAGCRAHALPVDQSGLLWAYGLGHTHVVDQGGPDRARRGAVAVAIGTATAGDQGDLGAGEHAAEPIGEVVGLAWGHNRLAMQERVGNVGCA